MSDSPPNRKSSIPILKQTNKTKSFQSYVSLNLNDESINDQQHSNKSRSPSTSPTENVQPKMPLNRVQLKQNLPKLEIDNDIVITKLCDENKRLKDHQTQLISKYEEALRENMEIQNKNDELQRELTQLRRDNAEKLHLQKTIENLQKQQIDMVEKNKKLQKKLEEILPESIKEEGSFESSRNVFNGLDLIMELEKLKSYLNNVELQLYEANEHVSDLLEKKQEMEAENIVLKSENAELKNLSKLMQHQMNESLDTSKRMEETFLLIKSQRDELIKRQNRDSTDGRTTITAPLTVTDEIANLKTELKRQKAHYEAQFIEYKATVEKEMEARVNSELESLKVQLQLLETELEIARNRAENAEEELRQFRASIRLSAKMELTAVDAEPKPPIPPPPPPLPLFNSTIRSRNNSQTNESLRDAISQAPNLLKPLEKKHQESAGLAAVIADLKSGKVTLRRRHKMTIPTSPKEDYSDIYKLLERNQKQNRSSIRIIDNELSTAFKKFNINI